MQVIEVTVPTGIRRPLSETVAEATANIIQPSLSILAREISKAALAPIQEVNRKILQKTLAPTLQEVNRSMARGLRSNPALSNLAKSQADLLEAIRKS